MIEFLRDKIRRLPTMKIIGMHLTDKLGLYFAVLNGNKTAKETLFYIHVGPGKTGTSVIQNWSLYNRKNLQKHGIFYHVHNTDSNGVSSGHQTVLLSQKNGEWYVDKEKVKSFLAMIKKRKPKIVLLSSERFWLHIEKLNSVIPNAKFIFYIRSPLEYFESTYNQGVKRSRVTTEINCKFIGFHGVASGIPMLLDMRKKIGVDQFIIRLYDRNKFKNGNVLYDFFNIFDITKLKNIQKNNLNSSYCIEALEFKRLVNNLPLSNTQFDLLDQLLQRYTEGNYNYSLIPSQIYQQFKQLTIEKMTNILLSLDVDEDARHCYISNLTKQEQKTVVEQSINSMTMTKILSYIGMNSKALKSKIELELELELQE